MNIDWSRPLEYSDNISNLSNPSIQREIEAAMWRAIDVSAMTNLGFGYTGAWTEEGVFFLLVKHDRNSIPAFSFSHKGEDVTTQVIKSLRHEMAS